MKDIPGKIVLLLALFIQPCLFLNAQVKKKSKAEKKEAALIQKYLTSHIAVLAHDSLEGRRTGTPGEMKTVNYLIARYREMGIPAISNNYIQAFEINEGKVMTEETRVTLNDIPLERHTGYFPLSWSGEGTINDIASVSLHENGAAWWIDLKEGMESNAKNPHFLPEQFLKEKVSDAVKKGATAVFVYNTGKRADSLAYHPKEKAVPASIPVIYFTQAALAKAGITVTSSPFVNAQVKFAEKKRTGHNVIAYLDHGAAKTVIIGAHLDHLGFGEDDNSRHTGEKSIHNGADDNASGTAALLELARIIKEKTTPTGKKRKKNNSGEGLKQNNYLFIHFSGEELGLYGSKYFVEHPVIDMAGVNFMINLDMIGRLNDSSMLTVGGYGTSPAWSQVLPAAPDYGLNIRIDSSGTGPSDHTSFYRQNIPVLYFFTGLHNDYHKPGDDIGKINFEGTARIIDYILQLLENTGSKAKFAFTKTREQSMGTTRFKVSVGIMPDYTYSGIGVKADGVIDGRPAQKAGMQTGDVIVQLGDYPVTGLESYMQALNKFDKGQSTTVTIKRGSEEKKLPLTFQ